jgi:hypothetical protein
LRLALIYYQGGVYLDTDVEPVKSIAPLYTFSSSMLVCHETSDQLGTAFIAARANSSILRLMLDRIPHQLTLRLPIYLQTGPGLVTHILKKHGTATVSVLHSSYFYPVPYGSCAHRAAQLVREARNPMTRTIGIHRWAQSWKRAPTQPTEEFCDELQNQPTLCPPVPPELRAAYDTTLRQTKARPQPSNRIVPGPDEDIVPNAMD